MLFLSVPAWLMAQSPTSVVSPKSSPSPSASTSPAASPTPPVNIPQAGQAKPQPTPYKFPNAHKRFSRYVNSIVGPVAIAEDVGLAGIMTWAKSPPEWGTHWEGFGRRVASNLGWSALKNTTIYGLDEAMQLDSYYYRSSKKGLGSRIGNAFISPFTAHTKSGRLTIGVSRLVGTYLAPVIVTEAWYPRRFSWKDSFRAGSYDLAWNIGFRLVKAIFEKK